MMARFSVVHDKPVTSTSVLVLVITYLLVDDRAETGIALNDGVWNTHVLAQNRQEGDDLDEIDIVEDEEERGLHVLDQADDAVETVLDSVGLLADLLLLPSLLDGSSFGAISRMGLKYLTCLTEVCCVIGLWGQVGHMHELIHRRYCSARTAHCPSSAHREMASRAKLICMLIIVNPPKQ
jgi:hypothetical protein